MYTIREFSAFYSHFQAPSSEMSHFRVTSGHLSSRDVISCQVTASYCELQPCRKLNVQHTRFFGIVQPLQVPSGPMSHFRVTSGHLRSHDVILVTCVPPTASNSLVGDFQSNDVTSGSLPVDLGQMTPFPVTRLPLTASYSFVEREMYSIRKFSAFYIHFHVTSVQMTSLPGHFRSNDTRSLPV